MLGLVDLGDYALNNSGGLGRSEMKRMERKYLSAEAVEGGGDWREVSI